MTMLGRFLGMSLSPKFPRGVSGSKGGDLAADERLQARASWPVVQHLAHTRSVLVHVFCSWPMFRQL